MVFVNSAFVIFLIFFLRYPTNMDDENYLVETVKYQRLLFSPLKKKGFIPENGTEVFVRQIPPEATEWELLEFFQAAGAVFQVRLMMSENGETNRGFGYVTYFDPSGAKVAVDTLNATDFDLVGRKLLVENSLNNCRLFIGGIPTYKRKDQVWQELYCKGVRNIIDVIMYRSYSDRAENRGFVFVEFRTHEEAAHFRAKYGRNLRLWDNHVVVDWSIPVPHVDDVVMKSVRIIYLRNLDVCQSREEVQSVALKYTQRHTIEKVYKFKNYAFIHLISRECAEHVLRRLKDYYKDTVVEVTWAKPPSKFTSQDYRHSQVSYMSSRISTRHFATRRSSSTSCLNCSRTREYVQNLTDPAIIDFSPPSQSRTPSYISGFEPNATLDEPTSSESPYDSFCMGLARCMHDMASSPVQENPLQVYQMDMRKIYGGGARPKPQPARDILPSDFGILPNFVPYYRDFIGDLLD